ncbi:PilZ domain-containing protein [Sphingomonas sp. M1-B02]|uniref:PilZ domain-containing protein n=1 Tax=Sphingomonas sp. M1-B02 TaxID=3114300 RepID=UPI00223F8552|nr:PilZ domain-containing protein [Sphingomonas sp. S6-11]UZK64884.1 PilZ domain-containing protein [Sphingomonas sp. S6-11]
MNISTTRAAQKLTPPVLDEARGSVELIGTCLSAAFTLPGGPRPISWDSGVRSTTSSDLEKHVSSAQRSEDRTELTVYRSAILRWGDSEALCLIRNISPGGAMGKIHAEIPRGAQVTVEIRSGKPLDARIAWSSDGQIGVQFEDCVDIEETLRVPASRGQGPLQRMPRLHVPCRVSLLHDGMSHRVMLLDISQGGARIDADFLHAGDEIVLNVPRLAQRRATVRWTRDGHAGIGFLAPIGFDQLAKWGEEHRSRQR